MIKKIINKYMSDESLSHLLVITGVYILAQGFLLFASGMWWDDWVYANKNWDYLLEVFMQSSLPLQAYIDASLWILPDGAYRILVFFFFYFGTLLVYLILRKIDLFSTDSAFWITLLYIVIPINDARITWICYGYSLGLFAFWIAFYLVTLWRGKKGKKSILMRILTLAVLIFSYNTESIMFMTLLILLYLYYEELKINWRWKELGNNIKKSFRTVVHYLDFLMAPIFFYFGKHLLFPGYGYYGGHNYVNWEYLPKIIINVPQYAYFTLKSLINNYYITLQKNIAIIVLFLFIFCYFVIMLIKKLSNNQEVKEEDSYVLLVIKFLVGLFVFLVGIFPYAVQRNNVIETIGAGGRDSLLLGIGAAISFYYGTNLIIRKNLRKIVYCMLIIMGVFHFNLMYFEWQEDYYQQLRFEAEIAENKEILKNDTFLCIYNYPPLIESFYQLNGNSWVVTGEESRYYLDSISDLAGLPDMNEESWILNAYNMREWDCSSTNHFIDGIIFINNTPIGNYDLLMLKIKELFNKEEFRQWIIDTKDITFIPVTKEESDRLIEASKLGTLTKDNIGEFVEAL